MLLVVWAQPAIVGATMFNRGIKPQRQLSRFDIGLALLVIVDVIGDQHFLRAVDKTVFLEINTAVLKNDFGLNFIETG